MVPQSGGSQELGGPAVVVDIGNRGGGVLHLQQNLKANKEQDKVNTADSAFIFLIILFFGQWSSGQVGQGREDGLDWSGLC